MFANNEKISLRQLKRLLVFDLFSVSGIIIPRIAAAASGKDGIITIILATLYAFIYVWIILALAKGAGGNFLEYSDRSVGKALTFLIGILYISKQFVCCVFAARLFGEVINETLLEDTDPRFIILLLLVVSAYSASKGFEVRARIAEVLYFIVIVPIFIFLVLGLNKVDVTNLAPLFTKNAGDIFIGGYNVFLTFSILELLLFAAPLIKFKSADVHRGRSLYHYIAKALIIVAILNCLIFIVTMGVLGQSETQQKLWSMVRVIQTIKLPGGFVQRQDAIILGIWMLSIFTIISAFFYYIGLISKHIFRIPKQNYVLVPFVLLIYAASVIPIETEHFFQYFETYMKYIGLPQSIILPGFVVLIGKLKKVSSKSAGKKTVAKTVKALLLFSVLASTVSLTGCSDMTEIEDRNFVQALGIDLKGEELTVYYILPDLKALTEQGSEDPKKLTIELKGYDFWQIEKDYSLKYNKRLDFSHLKAIVMGNDFVNNPKQLKEFLTYVENKYELGRNTLVFLSDSDADKVMKLNGELVGGLGDYLDRMYRVNLTNDGKKEITVGDLIHGMNEVNPVINIPILKAGDKTLTNVGLGMLRDNQVVYKSDQGESDYIDLANGFGKNNMIFLTENPSEDLKEDNSEAISQYVIKINNITRNLEFSAVNNKPYLFIEIEGSGLIEKGFKDSGITSQSENTKIITEIQDRCNKVVKARITDLIEKVSKSTNVDFMNLYRLTSYKKRKLWLDYQGKEEQFLQDLSYNIEVNLKMQ